MKKTISLQVPPMNIHIAVVGDVHEYREKLSKIHSLPEIDAKDACGLCTWIKEQPEDLWITFEKSAFKNKAIVVHEIIHAVDKISDWYGIKDTEFRAYLGEYLYENTVR